MQVGTGLRPAQKKRVRWNGTDFRFPVSAEHMNQPFSAALLSVTFILLIIVILSTPMFSGGFRPIELPITINPDKFGEYFSDDSVWIRFDETKYFEGDWVSDFSQHETELRDAPRIVLHADGRLNFGVVRETLAELSKYRENGVVFSVEERFVETKPTPFQDYLNRRSMVCECVW